MNDKQMLELAAKAAGYVIESHTEDGAWVYIKDAPLNKDGEPDIFLWRPRADDGDALRLAVKLGISIHYVAKDDGKTLIGVLVNDCELEEIDELDICKAARRAITRAAAEIGRVSQ